METVVLVIHLILAIALVGVILLQQSEGGALGIGGGGGGGGLFSARGAANLLTRTTAVLAVLFLATSITLAILAKERSRGQSVLDQAPASEAPAAPSSPSETPPDKKPEPSVPEPN